MLFQTQVADTQTVDTPPLLDEAVNESHTQTATDQSENISPEMSAHTKAVQREVDVTFLTQASPAHECNFIAEVMDPVVDDRCDDVMEGVFTDISFPSAVTSQFPFIT